MAPRFLQWATLAAWASSAIATPIHATAVRRAAGPSSTINAKCTLPTDDPKALWQNSNASAFLADWLNQNGGTKNWVANMDRHFTQDGGQTTSTLDCGGFPNGNCESPQVQCRYFTPPEQYYVRVAAANFYRFMLGVYNELADWVAINAQLNIDAVFDDWTKPPSTDFPYGIVIAGLTFGLAIFASEATTSGILNAALGVLTLTDAATKKDASLDPTKDIKAQLSAAWDGEKASIVSHTQRVFGALENSPEVVNAAFADGKFNPPNNGDGTAAIDNAVKEALGITEQAIMQMLAISTIKANKYFVWIDTSTDKGTCDTITGSRWLNNQCYMLAMKNDGTKGQPDVAYMDHDMILRLDDSNKPYKFNVGNFYQNAADCQGGDPAAPSLDQSSLVAGYPKCYVNLPVVTANKSPCLDKDHDWSSLGFDHQFCSPGGPCGGDITNCH